MAQLPDEWVKYLQPRLPPGFQLPPTAPAMTMQVQQGLPPPPVPIAPPSFSGPSAFLQPPTGVPASAPAPGPMAPAPQYQVDPSGRYIPPNPFTNPKEFQRRLREDESVQSQAESFREPSYERRDTISKWLMGESPVAQYVEEKAGAEAKKTQEGYMQTLIEGLTRVPGTTKINIPGGSALPTPRLPAPPNFAPARAALMESRPTEVPPQGDEEKLSSILGAAASEGAKGRTAGQILALAGGAAAQQYAGNKAQERKRVDVNNERQREFNRSIAQFEMTEAKTKYEAEWQRSTMEYSSALKQWELSQPKIQVTTNGLVIQKRGDTGTEIEFVPNEVLQNGAALSKDARKKAGLLGGAPWLAEIRARINAAPGMSGKQIAIATGVAQNMIRSGEIKLPAGEADDDEKKATLEWNKRAFGEFAPGAPKMLETAQRQARTLTQNLGLSPGTKEYHEKYMENLYVTLGTTVMQNPVLFNRWFAVTFGTMGR